MAVGAVRTIFAGGQIEVKFEVICGFPPPKLGLPVNKVIEIPLDVAVAGLAQVALEVIETVIIEPLGSETGV